MDKTKKGFKMKLKLVYRKDIDHTKHICNDSCGEPMTKLREEIIKLLDDLERPSQADDQLLDALEALFNSNLKEQREEAYKKGLEDGKLIMNTKRLSKLEATNTLEVKV